MFDWASESAITPLLKSRGFTQKAADSRAALFTDCGRRLLEQQSIRGLRGWWVPGRIEVLGKHTDYAGGRSLLCATDRGVACVVNPRGDATVTIEDLRTGQQDAFEIHHDLETTTGDWTNYPRTAARRITRNFGPLRGADIAFKSDLPLAAGMSSSSALIVTFATVLLQINELQIHAEYRANISTDEELAGYLGTVENGQTFGTLEGDAGVGTFGGSEDHTAILCSSPSLVKEYAFCPIRHERSVSLPENLVFVIGSSGVVAEKTGDALELYNRASRLAAAVSVALSAARNKTFAHIAAALEDVNGDNLRESISDSCSGQFTVTDMLNRFDQFVVESEEIIPAATEALAIGDIELFGRLVDRSQETGVRLLGNQVAQTIWLARKGRKLGALAASAFGAGFGGSVWALVEQRSACSFSERWCDAYLEVFPELSDTAEFLTTGPGPSAFELEIT